MSKIVSLAELKASIGVERDPTDWLVVDQGRISAFADATLDRQFIHIDPERAGATPLGGTIAHGFLTLSLLPHFSSECALIPEDLIMAINYGLNKVRFLNPVKTGSAVRACFVTQDVVEKGGGRILVTNEVTIEIEGKAENENKPALIAETLTLFMTGGAS